MIFSIVPDDDPTRALPKHEFCVRTILFVEFLDPSHSFHITDLAEIPLCRRKVGMTKDDL